MSNTGCDDAATAETSSGSITLAFEVRAIEEFEDPATVFEDARQWSTYVGVISDKMAYQVVNYLREAGVYNEDFFSRADKATGLGHVKSRTDTDRYIFVGRTDEDEALATEHCWEYLTVREAAKAAEWELTGEPTEQ